MNLREFVLIFEGSTPEKIKKGCANNLLTHPVTFGLTITLGSLSIGKGKYFVNCKKNARLIEVKTRIKEFCALTEILHDLKFTQIQKIHTLTQIPHE